MNMKKLLCLLLTAALLCGLLAGCGSSSSSDDAEETVTEEAEEVEETEAEAEETEETEEAAEEVEEEAEEAVEETEEAAEAEETAEIVEEETAEEAAAVVISYPFAEQQTFSVFCAADSMAFMLMSQMGLEEDWNNVPTLEYVYEQINIQFEFVTPSETGASEQFNLMIASGDWTDLFESTLYTGGTSQAYSDDVILDLTDLVAENMPDYMALLEAQDVMDQANAYNDSQQILSINDISAMTERTSGLLMRQDMLDALGLETPQTPDELYSVLEAVYAAYGTDQTIYVGNDGILANVVGAFGCAGFDISGDSSDPGFYVEDGVVTASLLSDNYYAYLEYLISLYEAGLISPDFYSEVSSASSMDALSLGSSVIWSADGGLIDSMTEQGQQEIEGYELTGIASIVAEAGDTYHFASALSTVETEGTCITTSCENPELALQMLNWFFTEDGRQFCTWGVEDITYTVDGDTITFTEAVTDGIFPVNLMYGFYVWSPCAIYIDKSVLYTEYSDNMLAAYSIWGEDDSSQSLPGGLSLTTEETETYTALMSDIITFASEQVLKFILGNEALTEESWAAFGETLDTMGIQDCIAIYQNAYDRYLNRVA